MPRDKVEFINKAAEINPEIIKYASPTVRERLCNTVRDKIQAECEDIDLLVALCNMVIGSQQVWDKYVDTLFYPV